MMMMKDIDLSGWSKSLLCPDGLHMGYVKARGKGGVIPEKLVGGCMAHLPNQCNTPGADTGF